MKKVAQTLIVADSYYTIANASGKVMEGMDSKENGAAVKLGNDAHKPTQEWSFLRVGEGVYRIRNRGTGKMLDLMMGGTADGTWLHQWEDANCSSQMWIVEPTNDGRVKLRAQMASGKCIDVVGMSSEAGARLQIWQDVNGENQLWKISPAVEKKAHAYAPKAGVKAEKAPVKAETKKPAVKEEAKAPAVKELTPEKTPAAAAKAPAAKAEAPKAAAGRHIGKKRRR
ncbi:MAG: RICIN domain-containing protein [Faecalibacterium sp.]|nr:RICIN domain-containing protein [Faecalibacterium sp.]